MSEHLKFDTDFLDSNNSSSPKKAPHYHKESFPSRNTKKTPIDSNRNKYIMIGVVTGIVLLVIIIAANSPETTYVSPTTTSSPTKANTIPTTTTPIIPPTHKFTDNNGITYYCDDSEYSTATSLEPSAIEKSEMASKEEEITSLKSDIDSSYVNEYSSEYAIDQYNDQVDEYNRKREIYNRRVDSYNQKVNTYNNYLKSNCTLSQ